MKRFFQNASDLARQSFKEFQSDQAARLGAALSYYTVFSIAPIILVVIGVAGLVWGQDAARSEVGQQLASLFGKDAAGLIQSVVVKASEKKSGVLSSVVGLVTLIFGATGVMIELQGALNTVWKVKPQPGLGVGSFVRQRLLSFALIMSIGFLLLVSLVASTSLEVVSHWMGGLIPGWVFLGYVLNYGLSLAGVTLFFALIFKVLPDVKVAWRDVWIGGFATSVLFNLGKYLISLYLGRASPASAFGAAGSLAILLVWVYYSSQIVLLGAEFTRVYANKFGKTILPDKNALAAPRVAT